MFNYSEVKLRDFSGGITDRYIDGPANTSKTITNLDITKFRTLEIRDGFKWYLEAKKTSYALSNSTGYMGTVRLLDSSNIIISQGVNFFLLNKEVRIESNATSNAASIKGYISSNKIFFVNAHNLSNDDGYCGDCN